MSVLDAYYDQLQKFNKELKKLKKKVKKMKEIGNGGRLKNTKAAVKTSLGKQIDGKTMIAIAIYLIFKFWQSKYPSILNPTLGIAIDIGIWIICLLFNIDNPSVAKVFRQIGEFLLDMDLDPEVAMKEMRIWYAALGQQYMKIFDSQGEKIDEGIIRTLSEEEEIKKESEELK